MNTKQGAALLRFGFPRVVSISMGPRFIESKKRGKSSILRGKGVRNVSRKLNSPAVLSSKREATNTNDVLVSNSNSAESPKESFIGKELIEFDDSMRKAAENERASIGNTPRIPPKLARPRRCLGFDTRALLDASSGKRYGAISNDMNKFMNHLTIRGYHVPVLASSVSDPNKRDKIQTVEKETGMTRVLSYVSAIGVSATTSFSEDPLDDTLIEASLAIDIDDKIQLKEVPNTLTADFTWNMVGDLVLAVNDKMTIDGGPQQITIISSELAFFADADLEAHVAALGHLVKRLSPLYSEGRIDSLQIVLLSCESVSYNNGEGCCGESPAAYIDTLRRKMEDLEYQPLVTSFEALAAERCVHMSIERIGSSAIESLALSRRWVRESICGHEYHVTLDLPETSDSQCSVTFDISYQLCPMSLTSPFMNDLISDLKCISAHGLVVVQRIPFSSLDASLIFGVPFVMQAGLHCDLDRYRETQTIVSTLLRLLDDREEALILSIKKSSALGKSDTHGIFVSGTRAPMFVFMAKHSCGSSPPTKAILFRIAGDADLLAETETSPLCNPTLDDDVAVQYTSYIESSLSSLPSNAFNPMLSPQETNHSLKASMMDKSGESIISSNLDLSVADENGQLVDHDAV